MCPMISIIIPARYLAIEALIQRLGVSKSTIRDMNIYNRLPVRGKSQDI